VISIVTPHVRSGKMKGLAIAAEKRAPGLPDVPTTAEAGMPDFAVSGWYGLLAPAKTPKDIVERQAKAAIDAVHAPDVKQRLEQMGLEPTGLGPAELAKVLRADYDKWGPVIRASGFKPQ
jgi:tripartite-type tricarboxylate transporter receptor subunit TctC